MADSGKQSPLGQNVLGGILQNKCLQINKHAELYMGASKTNASYYPGRLVTNTVLRMLTWSINSAYNNLFIGGSISNATYKNLISISGNNNECYALGNSMPPTYKIEDPSGVWTDKANEYGGTKGPANAGYSEAGDEDQQQNATWWDPYNDVTDPNVGVTQWGYIRLHALQAWNEFNWHGKSPTTAVDYQDFCSSFLQAQGYIEGQNAPIYASEDAQTFGEGSFSNMNDLITADLAGVNLSLQAFGNDLENLGKLFDPKRLDRFGFPSTLLQQLYKGGGMTEDLNLSLAAAGLTANQIAKISSGTADFVTVGQERQIYGAFLLVFAGNLRNCIAPLAPNLLGDRISDSPSGDQPGLLRTLADCLDIKRLFPNSYPSMTVPLYNNQLGLPTNSKTYYLIYDEGTVNASLNDTAIQNRIGTIVCEGQPPIRDDIIDNPFIIPPEGYDSYLRGCVPQAIGLAAGAFRYSMLQVTNIEQLDPSKVVCFKGLEINENNGDGADGTGSTDDDLAKPINKELQAEVPKQLALGSGYAGTFTFSDFFGCMSGLPYAWQLIFNNINRTGASQAPAESILAKIYQQLYLAVTWEAPAIDISLEYQCVLNTPKYANPANPDYQPVPTDPDYDPFPYLEYNDNSVKTMDQWTVATFFGQYKVKSEDVLTGDGGGYGRGGAPDPICSINYGSYSSDGTSVTISGIGRNDSATGTSGGTLIRGGFGRIQGASTSGGSFTQWASTPSPIPATQGAPDGPPPGFSGISSPQDSNPGYNAPVANTDIVAEPEYPPTGTYDKYATNGTNSAFGSSFNYNTVIQDYIDQANDEIPNIVDPEVAYPLGVENLNVAWDVLGRQLKVEQRTRYISINPVEVPRSPFVSSSGTVVTFVDSIPTLSLDTRPHMSAQTIEAIVDRNCAVGQSAIAMMRQERNQKRLANCGIPLSNNLSDKMSGEDQTIITTNGTIEPATEGIPRQFDDLVFTNPAFPNNPGPSGPVYPQPQGYYSSPYFFPVVDLVPYGDYTPILQDVAPVIPQVFNDGNDPTLVVDPNNPGDPGDPGDSSGGGGGQGGSGNGGPINGGGETSPPGGGGTGGTGNESGPFGGSGIDGNGGNNGTITNPVIIRDVIPKSQQTINLNPNYTGGVLQPAGISVDDAIEQVILCNCDCWDLI